jgi:NAD(P)-dependent dehydrogenase (short-subunit alcohol dehydrogenase family)
MAGMVEGKVALVTGGGKGIGRAAAILFSMEGARVVVADVDEDSGIAVTDEIRRQGGKAHFVRADVSVEADVERLVAETVSTFGRLDCALNNAGITGTPGPVHETSADDWSRTISINLSGVFHSLKHELPVMIEQGSGAIVNMSSGAGFIGTPGLAAYCASKHAILGLTKTAALENARTGVRINAICPGSTDTPMLQASMAVSPQVEKMIVKSMPGGRLGKPEEIAEAAVWLCSDRASFVNGHSMLVDGGSVAR